jgi:hypothetical protein
MGKSIDIEAQIIAPLAAVNKALKEITIKLGDIRDTASTIGGQVGPAMNGNLQKAINQIQNVMSGADQSSIRSIITYIGNVPVSKTFSTKTLADLGEGDIPGLDTATILDASTPDVSSGPQSAIFANESHNPDDILGSYFKENYKDAFKEAVAGSPEILSMDRLKECGMINSNIDFGDAAVANYDEPIQEEIVKDENGTIMNEAADISSWRNIARDHSHFDLGDNAEADLFDPTDGPLPMEALGPDF